MVFTAHSPKALSAVWLQCRRIGIMMLAGLLCSGCLPLRYTTSPGASGTVVDAQTHAPLAGAEVVVSNSTYPPNSAEEAFINRRSPIVMTDTAGQFSIPPERAWDLYFLPIDAFAPFGLLVVKRDGYESALVPMWSRSVEPVGEVLMKPSPKKE